MVIVKETNIVFFKNTSYLIFRNSYLKFFRFNIRNYIYSLALKLLIILSDWNLLLHQCLLWLIKKFKLLLLLLLLSLLLLFCIYFVLRLINYSSRGNLHFWNCNYFWRNAVRCCNNYCHKRNYERMG